MKLLCAALVILGAAIHTDALALRNNYLDPLVIEEYGVQKAIAPFNLYDRFLTDNMMKIINIEGLGRADRQALEYADTLNALKEARIGDKYSLNICRLDNDRFVIEYITPGDNIVKALKNADTSNALKADRIGERDKYTVVICGRGKGRFEVDNIVKVTSNGNKAYRNALKKVSLPGKYACVVELKGGQLFLNFEQADNQAMNQDVEKNEAKVLKELVERLKLAHIFNAKYTEPMKTELLQVKGKAIKPVVQITEYDNVAKAAKASKVAKVVKAANLE